MSQGCTLGVDIGTSSSKGVLVDAAGGILATAVREHEVSRPSGGHVEMGAGIWWREFVEIAGELLESIDGIELTAIGVSGMGPCVLLADDDLHPVRPAILYGVDTRAGAQIERMNAELGVDRIVEHGGSSLTSQAAGPKMLWISDNEPDAAARARRLYMPASWLLAHLTGEYALDHHSASQCTPLYDVPSRSWHAEWWQRYAEGITPPRLTWAGETGGTVTAAASAATGIPEGTPVITGTIDAWSEAVSVGAQDPGDLMLMYGTTMFLIATTDELLRTPSMWTTLGVTAGTSCLAGGMATSGAITSWLRDLVGGSTDAGPDFAQLTSEARASGPGANGLVMLPYFAGERTPILDPDARGVIAGLTLSHTRGDLYRAALEATAFGVRHNIETLREAGARIDRVVAVGGGTQGALWTQIVSDVTGLAQEVPSTTIGASYGAAFLAATASASLTGGAAPDIAEWNPIVARVEPDPATRSRYDAAYALYRRLYETSAPVVHAMVALDRAHAGARDDAEGGEREVAGDPIEPAARQAVSV